VRHELRIAGGGLLIRAAALHRRRLRRVHRVAVTGSCGKTVTKELVAAVLSTRSPGTRTPAGYNSLVTAARALLATSPRDGFCVIELGVTRPGSLTRVLATVRPGVGVVTAVGTDHYAAFRGPEAVAAEKSRLVGALPESGIAVLNADDARVRAMAALCRGRVVTFGTAPDADVRAEDVSAAWPDRLSFTLVHAGRSTKVRTRLAGAHLLPCVLAALATGAELGIPLDDAVRAVEAVEPEPLRMQPVEVPGGVTFIRDEMKAPVWSLPAVYDFLRSARARRKVLVLGTLSDYPGAMGKRYARVAREALAAADRVVFVGPHARLAAKAAPPGSDALVTFPTVREAAAFLERDLLEGDLVLLKGSDKVDHLGRLVLSRLGEVTCWRERCGRAQVCDRCELLAAPPGLPVPFNRTFGVASRSFRAAGPAGPARAPAAAADPAAALAGREAG
jgi:UDP-N-acetylmuramyl pentapeptide synthase